MFFAASVSDPEQDFFRFDNIVLDHVMLCYWPNFN